MTRAIVLFTMLTAVAGIRLRLEDDAPAPFEEEDEGAVNAAVEEELAFTQTVDSDDFTVTDKMKLKEKEQEESDASLVTLQRDKQGKITCENCRGDPSDMVNPFWRFSASKANANGRAVTSMTVPAKTHFWNAKETAKCFKDKYVLMLGDSTLVENLDDMLFLLAGGPKKVNAGKFYQDVTHQTHGSKLKWPGADGEVKDSFYSRNRNQTIEIPNLNTIVKYRFIGAVKLADNCGGLEVMLNEVVKEEIDMLVANGGRKPDVILIHSAAHDMCHSALLKRPLSSFYQSIDKVGTDFIKPWVQQGINVIWRGSYRFPNEEQNIEVPKFGDYRIPAKLDYLAKKTMDQHGAKYVDTADLIANVHDESGCCGTIKATTKTFPHLGAVSVFHDTRAATFLSQLVSYQILDAMCPSL